MTSYLGKPSSVGVISNSLIGVTGWDSISIQQQHFALAHSAGVFEASAMAYFHIKGPQSAALLNYLTPRDIHKLMIHEAMFVVFTNAHGTVDDEGVLLRLDDDEFLVSCGGCKPLTYLAEAMDLFPDAEVSLSDMVSFNIKGPKRLEAMLLLIDEAYRPGVQSLCEFKLRQVLLLNQKKVWVLRTKIGMEMWGPADAIEEAWTYMLQQPETYTPCGWDALHSYRMECNDIQFLLYPLELNHNTSLWEIGCGWMVGEKLTDFIGKKELLKSKNDIRFIIKKIRMTNADISTLEAGTRIYTIEGELAGYITSSAFSIKHNRLLAFVHIRIEYKNVVCFSLMTAATTEWIEATSI